MCWSNCLQCIVYTFYFDSLSALYYQCKIIWEFNCLPRLHSFLPGLNLLSSPVLHKSGTCAAQERSVSVFTQRELLIGRLTVRQNWNSSPQCRYLQHSLGSIEDGCCLTETGQDQATMESRGELPHCFCYSGVSIKKAHPSPLFKMTFTPSYPKVPCLCVTQL